MRPALGLLRLDCWNCSSSPAARPQQALDLYKVYAQRTKDGTLHKLLEEVYAIGRGGRVRPYVLVLECQERRWGTV